MEGMEAIDDLEIQRKVESLAGKGTKVLDCEKSSSFKTEEVLLINGYPVHLQGEEGARIKTALLTGQIPPCDLLNDILIRAGILKAPVELETTLSSKCTTKTTEVLTLRDKNGLLVDERLKEVEEDNEFRSQRTEVWTKENEGLLGRSLERMEICPFGRSSSSASASTDETSSPSASSSFSSPRFSPSLFGTSTSSASPTPEVSYFPQTNFFKKAGVLVSGNGSLATGNGAKDSLDSSSIPKISKIPPSTMSSSASDWDSALVYEDSNLVSGTIDALIQHLVPTQTHYPERAYVFAFLLSSRLYIRPHELLGRVFRLATATPQHSNKFHTARETKIISHVVKLLGEWAQLFPYDFRDERMMAHVRTITQKCVSVDPLIRKDVSQLLTSLLARLTSLERYEDFLHRINTEAALSQPLSASSVLTICPNPTMLAQQLTHIELERLGHIGPEEFVQAFAKDNVQIEPKCKDLKKTRNLESYVQWFNRLSFYVATEVCKMPKKKTRIRVIEYWIETARECFNIGNFNSLMAVIAGLNMSPVARLRKTWSKVSSAQLSILEHQMDPSSNFTSYRSTLKAAVWRSTGAIDERQRIVIPFFSLLVKDLFFLNEACASKLLNGHINFEKFWQLAKQVTEVMAWQRITCPFPKVQAVLNSLQTAPIFNETELCLSSYDCEGADNAQEKERLKYLRQGENKSKKLSTSAPATPPTLPKEDLNHSK